MKVFLKLQMENDGFPPIHGPDSFLLKRSFLKNWSGQEAHTAFTVQKHNLFMFTKSHRAAILSHFMPLVSFYTPLRTWENQRFSDVFRGYRKSTVAWNGLISSLRTARSKFCNQVWVGKPFLKIRYYLWCKYIQK